MHQKHQYLHLDAHNNDFLMISFKYQEMFVNNYALIIIIFFFITQYV